MKANLVDLAAAGMSVDILAAMQFKKHPLMQDNTTVASKVWLAAEIMPHLTMAVQDNFLKVQLSSPVSRRKNSPRRSHSRALPGDMSL